MRSWRLMRRSWQECGIAWTTDAKALKVLVDEGLAEVVPGWGTCVVSDGRRIRQVERLDDGAAVLAGQWPPTREYCRLSPASCPELT
jgi:hypothetical protein